MSNIRIVTKRSELLAGTVEIARAEINDRSQFSYLLNERVPKSSPPTSRLLSVSLEDAF